MTTDLRKLLQEVTENWEDLRGHEWWEDWHRRVRVALAEPAPEPVAWMMYDESKRIPLVCHLEPSNRHLVDAFPVYRAPPPTASPDDARDAAREPSVPHECRHCRWLDRNGPLVPAGRPFCEQFRFCPPVEQYRHFGCTAWQYKEAAIEREGGAK